MTRATARIGTDDYATQITVGHRDFIADEPADNGGKDAGLAPYDLLVSALGACTAITLRMYAERKVWPLESAEVALHFYREDGVEKIERIVTLSGDLDGAQRERLAQVCERTPVTLTLKNGLAITTRLTDAKPK